MRLVQRVFRLGFTMAVLACLSPALAADEEQIRRAISDFLDKQATSLPGPARHSIGPVNAANIPGGCRRIAVSLQNGAKPWGRSHVQARCSDGANWSLFVPVEIHVIADYLVSARPLQPGQILTVADVATRRGDLAELPGNILTDPAQAIGQSAAAALAADRPLRADLLKMPVVIRQGQNTRVVSAGGSYQVASEGKAMGSAVAGQVVQIRMGSGQVISGVALPDGTVRVTQ